MYTHHSTQPSLVPRLLLPAFQCYTLNIEKLGVAWVRGYTQPCLYLTYMHKVGNDMKVTIPTC